MKSYADFEVPNDLVEKTYKLVEKCRESGKIKKGVNETTKAIERGKAKLVVIALDVEPEEIVMHLPPLCKERKVPYTFVPKKEELGVSAGLKVRTAAVALTEVPDEKELEELVQKINSLQK
jgi:large subunit ribosomal protein L7Ae